MAHRIPPKCPKCASTDAIPYVYGYPDSDLCERERRGECIIAGCVVWPGQPAFRCRRCTTEFTKDGREPVTLEDVQGADARDSRPPSAHKTTHE